MRIPTHSLALTALLATGAVLGYSAAPGTSGSASPRNPSPASAGTAASAAVASPVATPVAPGTPGPASSPAPLPTADADDAPYYAEGQFTARFEQTRNTWRLLPIDGPDRLIDAGACSTGATAPAGVWLLVVSADGRAELVAPSATPLAAGEPDRIALRACDQASGRELAVPQTVIDLLASGTGAVYVDR
jgi:hypothetical protein